MILLILSALVAVSFSQISTDGTTRRLLAAGIKDASNRGGSRQLGEKFVNKPAAAADAIQQREAKASRGRKLQDFCESHQPFKTWATCELQCAKIITDENWNIICSCAEGCEQYGNCCPDFEEFCPWEAECQHEYQFWSAGHGDCDTYAPGESNHEYCEQDYDCVNDIYAFQACPQCGRCTEEKIDDPLAGIGTFETCKDSCGKKSIYGNCWCDAVCEAMGDCCFDFQDRCPLYHSDTPTCFDHCGEKANSGTCWCDKQCTFYQDCCPDYSMMCSRRELLEDDQNIRGSPRLLTEKNTRGTSRQLTEKTTRDRARKIL